MATKIQKLGNDYQKLNQQEFKSNIYAQSDENRIGELMQEKSLSPEGELYSMGLAVENSSNSVGIKGQRAAEIQPKEQDRENNKRIKKTKKEIERLEKALKKDIEDLEVLKSDYENGTTKSKIFSKLSPKQEKTLDICGGIGAFAIGIPLAVLADMALAAEGVFFVFCGGMALGMAAGYLLGHLAAKGIMKLHNRSKNKDSGNIPQLIVEQEKKINEEKNRLEQLKASL